MSSPQMQRLTLARLNERNARFWRKQSKLMNQRMADEAILKVAVMDVNSESSRGVILRYQQTFEQALAKAVEAKRIVVTEIARKGGRCSAPR